MNTEEFLELLEHPERIADQNIDRLRELAHRYSYSQPMQLLYALRLRYSSEHLFDRQLGKTSILTNDRSILFELFEEPTKVSASAKNVEVLEPKDEAEPVLKDLQPELRQEELEEKASSLEDESGAGSGEEPPQVVQDEKETEAPTSEEFKEAPQKVQETAETEPDKTEKAQEAMETAKQAAEKPVARSEMNDRIKEILERSRKLRQDLDQKRSAGKKASEEAEVEPPKQDIQKASAEEPSNEPSDHKTEKSEPLEAESLEGGAQLSQTDEREVKNTTNDFVDQEESAEKKAAEGKAPREVNMKHREKTEDDDQDSIEGEVLVDEGGRKAVNYTTSDFIEEDEESTAETPEIKVSQQEATSLEEEALMAEKESEETSLTDLPEEKLAQQEKKSQKEGEAKEEEPTAIEARIASIRKRLARLHNDEEQESLGETEEEALVSEKKKPEAELTTNNMVEENEEVPASSSREAAEEDLDEEYLEIQALVDQHRKERESVLVDQVEEPEEEEGPEDKDLTIDRDALEQKVNDSTDEAMTNEEAQRYSFSRWVRQFEKSSAEKPADKAREEKPTPSKVKKDEENMGFERKVELLDSFVEKLPDLKKRKPLLSNPPKADSKPDRSEGAEEEESGSLVTETLAKVYIRQKHYKKAVQAYEILKLKYPEKSGFFASRISEINKLANSK